LTLAGRRATIRPRGRKPGLSADQGGGGETGDGCALVAVSHRLGDNTNDNLSLPGTDSYHATTVLKRSFPAQANGTSPIVLRAKTGKLTDQNNANAVNQAAENLSKNEDVAQVINPLTPQGASAPAEPSSSRAARWRSRSFRWRWPESCWSRRWV
jgi:hypothetical protein